MSNPLEKIVLASQRDVLTLEQIPHGMKHIGGGRKVAIKSCVDFVGTVNKTGRAFFCDAKQCQSASSFPIGNRDHVSAHQIEILIRHGKAGAISGLLIESTMIGSYFWLDWRGIEKCQRQMVKSIKWVDAGDTGLLTFLGPSTHAIQFRMIPAMRCEISGAKETVTP